MTTLSEKLKNARSRGCPLIGITTPDMAATIATCSQVLANGTVPPIFSWDSVTGLRWLNQQGETVAVRLFQNAPTAKQQLSDASINPTELCLFALRLDHGSVIFMQNAHAHFDQPSVIQALYNLRDPFKATKRTMIILGPTLRLPLELSGDFLVFDEKLPDDSQIGEIADALYALTGNTTKFPRVMRENVIKAARGLSAFGAEQATALALNKQGVDVDALWVCKKQMVEAVRGLSFAENDITFSDIGGLGAVKEFGAKLFSGARPPSLICWVDEIEKALGGASGPVGDSSGTSQDALGVLLKNLEDSDASGLIAVGPPGAGKSLFAKALGATHHVPTLFVDLGAARGSLVGESEQRIRAMMHKINAIAGKGGAFWVATANKLDIVPPELRRRFRYGTWMFPMPDKDERDAIWTLNLKKYGLINKGYNRPADEFLTGADIRSICELSWRLGCGLEKAMTYISPIAISDPESIERLYTKAEGRFLSASHGGLFKREQQEVFTHEGRKVSV